MFQNPEDRYILAMTMLDLFASVNVTHFDITTVDLDNKKVAYYSKVAIDRLKRAAPVSLDAADKNQNSIVIRPRHVSPVSLVQLDDLNAEKLEKVQPVAFLTHETSPDNYQAWVAIQSEGLDMKEIGTRFRKGVGADVYASGATRLAGSLNFKHKYAPNFPLIVINHQNPSLIGTVEQLETMNFLAPKELLKTWVEKTSPTQREKSFPNHSLRRYPSYDYWTRNAPLNQHGRPDTTYADFVWCMTAADWGFGVEQIAAQLLRERTIKHNLNRNKEGYAECTAQKAFEAAQRNKERRR